MKYISPSEFSRIAIEKGAMDIDGAYGYQCVDLFLYYTKLCFDFTCRGNADDFFLERYTNGLLNYFDVVEGVIEDYHKLEDGDWVCWGSCYHAPNSHVAMFRHDAGNNFGIFLGQNQDGVDAPTERKVSYDGIIGAFRSKAKKEDEKIKQEIERLQQRVNDLKKIKKGLEEELEESKKEYEALKEELANMPPLPEVPESDKGKIKFRIFLNGEDD